MSILLITIKCSPAHPWTSLSAQYSTLFLRWKVICAFDIITEAALFLISIYIVFDLQMSFKRKAIIVTVFGLRIP
jgi:hypothetical protein